MSDENRNHLQGTSEPPAEWEDIIGTGDADQPPGRPPSLVLAIIGDSGAGKTTVCSAVAALLGPEQVLDFRLDDYHRFTREQRAERGLTPLDPAVHNLELMAEHLARLRAGHTVLNRSYEHGNGTFGPTRAMEPRDIVLACGLLGLATTDLANLYDLSVFLRPEPELLYRWKLRRDVIFRGYTEAQALKNIADHLLDAKEFVLPQSERADVVVDWSLPNADAPDSEVQTSIRFRGRSAEIARRSPLIDGLPVELQEEAGELVFEVPADLTEDAVDQWALTSFDSADVVHHIGEYHDEDAIVRRRPSLAVVELTIAAIARQMLAG